MKIEKWAILEGESGFGELSACSKSAAEVNFSSKKIWNSPEEKDDRCDA